MTECRPTVIGRKREAAEMCIVRSPSRFLRSRLQTMISMERSTRKCNDQVAVEDCTISIQNHPWRERVAQWCYDVVDHLGASREVVYHAMNILDRYLAASCEEGSMDKLDYELASITSLFLALRVSGAINLKVTELLQMSRSGLQIKDILSTGTIILEALTWEHRILTPTDFVKAILGLLQSAIDCKTCLSLYELSSYLVEISVCDQNFSRIPPSKIAFVALLVAMKCDPDCAIDQNIFTYFIHMVHQETGMSLDSAEIKPLFSRLQRIYKQSQDSSPVTSPHLIIDEEEETTVNIQRSSDILTHLKNSDVTSAVADLRPTSP
jgi:hypothetical protein